MTSKNLYFKLMKEDLKSRIWAVALIGLAFFFQFPVIAALRAGSIDKAYGYEKAVLRYGKQMQELVSFSFGWTVFVMIVIALICGMSSFSYLNSKSKVDFYHGIPLRREKLYVANYLNGILIMAVPYAVMLLLGVMIAIGNGANAAAMWQTAGQAFWLNLIYYILMYSTVIVAVMMTGNLVVSLLGLLVFCSFIPLTIALIMAYFSEFFYTFFYTTSETILAWGMRVSPVAEYVYQVSEYYRAFDQSGIGHIPAMAVTGALVVSAILAILGGFLYKKRPSEAAGRAMAFQVSKPIIRILITMVSSMGMGLFFWSMQGETGWGIFGILCGGVIAHCVVEIIYHFDFKKLFSNRRQLVGCLTVALLLFCVFRYDWFGYDRYIPKESQVKTASININAFNSWTSYGDTVQQSDGSYEWESIGSDLYVFEHGKETEVKKVLALAEEGIAEAEILKAERENYKWGSSTSVTIQYQLNSGRKVSRTYSIRMEKSKASLEALYTEPTFKETIYPVLTLKPEQVEEVRYLEIGPEVRLNPLTLEEKTELLTAYQQDLQKSTLVQMGDEMPVGLLRFMKPQDVAGIAFLAQPAQQENNHYDYSNMERRDFYPVYPSFVNTNRVLEQYGITPGDDLTELQIQEITVSREFRYSDDSEITTQSYDKESNRIFIQDKKEIEALTAILINQETQYYNGLYQVDAEYVATITYQDENGYMQTKNATLPKNQVPEFVKSRLTNP